MINLMPYTLGSYLHTRHLRGGSSLAIDQIIFSPDDTKLACVGYRNEAISVWDLGHEEPRLQLEGPDGGVMVAFGSGSNLVATCGRRGIHVRDCASGDLICRTDLPDDMPFVRPTLCDLSPLSDELVVVVANRLLVYDSSSCKLCSSYQLSKTEDILVHRLDHHPGILTAYFSDFSTSSNAFRVVDVLANRTKLAIDLEADDYPLVSSTGRFSVIIRKQRTRAEVWDLFGATIHNEIDIPSKWHTTTFGPQGTMLAVSYSHSLEPRQRVPNLYIWDLQSGICAQTLAAPFPDVLWSEHSILLAMTDFSEQSRLPESSRTLFFNPLDGIIYGHTDRHRGHTHETFCFSQLGRWFASLFTFDYTTDQGGTIPAGTVALTDLTSILPLLRASISSSTTK